MLDPGSDLESALADASPGSVLCLRGERYPGARIAAGATEKPGYVTLRAAPGESPVFAGELAFDGAEFLRLEGLAFREGLAFVPAASHVQVIDNDLSGPGGIFFFGDPREGGRTEAVLIEGNDIHDIDYKGPQSTYGGYGIKSIGHQHGFTVRGNTIRSVAADYIQTDVADDWSVEGNTFLGPSRVAGHPQEHQDLWQVYASGTHMTFAGNVARHTGTGESLLFQMSYPEDRFSDVTVRDNLFDHDTEGYTCQIYQAKGLVFRDNTIVGSRWGCLFHDDTGFPAGSGYAVDHNVFAETEDGSGLDVDEAVAHWGDFDYNVSSDGSVAGASSVPGWAPQWANTVDYRPLGLPFAAGYRPER